MLDGITFDVKAKPEPEELLAFFDKQQHKVTHSLERIQRMLDSAFCCVTARRGGELIGFARGVTDGVWGRLADCKLDPAFQGPACVTRTDGRIEHDAEGIAREMACMVIQSLRDYGVDRIEAVAYGTEVDFCEELGFSKERGMVALSLPASAPLSAAVASAGGSGS